LGQHSYEIAKLIGSPPGYLGHRETSPILSHEALNQYLLETEMIGDDGIEDLTVEIKTTTSHKVPLFKLKAWLESSGHDPREAALKSKLR
jgi:hypothetical protein